MFSSPAARLKAGQKAPDFSVAPVAGKRVTLSQIKSRYVLVVFFRYSGCPWCNLAIHRLALEYPTLKAHGCEVVAFIESDKTDIVSNIYGRHAVKPPFPIIADHEMYYYRQYGVSTSLPAGVRSIKQIPYWLHSVKRHGFKQTKIDGRFFMVPASFLINGRDRKLIEVSYGSSFYDTEAFMDIYQSVFFNEL